MDPTLPRFNPKEQAAVVPFFFMHEGEECVKVQIAGDTRFGPVFRASDMWLRDGLQEVTYKDRWPDQYAQFKGDRTQVADGTALEEAPFLNPSRIADLRQLKIYSLEALATLDDRNIPRLSGKGYELKQMAQEFLAKRQSEGANGKVAAMQRELEELRAMVQAQANQPVVNTDPYAGKTDDDLKVMIADRFGKRPVGQPSRATLISMLAESNVAA